MEQEKNKIVVQTKDAWHSAYKNFLHFGYFGVFLVVSVLFLVLTKNPVVVDQKNLTIASFIQIFVFTGGWFYLAQLFKNHKKSAINTAYIFLTVFAVYNFITSFNLLVLVVYGYFFYLVYRASKEKTIGHN